MQKRILLLWANNNDTRSETLAYYFDAKYYRVSYFKLNRTNRYILAPIKYIFASVKTIQILFFEKPDMIFVINPPIFAVFIVWLYTRFTKARFVIDSHSAAFDSPRWKIFIGFFHFLAKYAVINIVHNQPLAQIVAQWGASVIEMGYIPFHLVTDVKYELYRGFNIVYVCTFAGDEPIDEVLKAAIEFPEVNFYITGNINLASKDILRRIPNNVILTGFIPDKEYVALLKGCDLVISLTTRDNTMQNGAYEALELGIPVITSNWPVLKSLFTKGSILIDNTCVELVKAIREMQKEHHRYCSEINELRLECSYGWKKQFDELSRLLK